MQEKRTQWRENKALHNVDRLVFLDESGININMARRYGRSIGKARVIDNVPLNTPKTTTVLSSMRLNGKMAYTTYEGGTTGDRFVSYIKEILLPTLTKGDIIVMDNMRSHHVKAVAEAIEDAGINLLYLPPYSPDMNPSEMLWSKLKSILRKAAVRCKDKLHNAIDSALACVSLSDCKNWFQADSYCPQF